MKQKTFIFLLLLVLCGVTVKGSDTLSFERDVRPLLETKCIKCHNTNKPKGGVNLDNYKEQGRVIQRGAFWLKVLDQIETRAMPPKTEPALNANDYESLVHGIDGILQASLKNKTPGKVVVRRLSHAEYQYTIQDLLGVDFDASSYFPSDGSGGGGFDNQGKALFFTPLKLERYYDAADQIIETAFQSDNWEDVVPFDFNPDGLTGIWNWIKGLFNAKYKGLNDPSLAAEKVINSFGSKAYRRFLKEDEKLKLMELFEYIYKEKEGQSNPKRFNESIAQVCKAMLVSPSFLYKVEEEPQKQGPYPLGDFEVATRLSYFLWCSMPDQELFDLAYAGKLHDSATLAQQVSRMLADPKSKRFAHNFTGQWLGITQMKGDEPVLDQVAFPEFDKELRTDLYMETGEFFHHVLTQSKNFLDLVQSDYSIINKRLAQFYEVEGVEHEDFQKVEFADNRRGGVLGMGAVLASTSVATRTSPVLRGKWVMEQILGISPPPPPPEVAELSEDEDLHEALGLRKILEMHRSKPECQSCHEKMDPLGLGLENYDPTGKWRETYEKVRIDASGITAEGEKFNGPAELKAILLKEEERIARNISKKMLSYALGRSILFTDEPAVKALQKNLLKNDFNPERFLIELVNSYPFLLKISDFEKKSV